MKLSKIAFVAVVALGIVGLISAAPKTAPMSAPVELIFDGLKDASVVHKFAVGDEFSVKFDNNLTTPVQWYVLLPVGPGIKFESVSDVSAPSPKNQGQGAARILGGEAGQRMFTFKVTGATGPATFMFRFILIDFSNKIYNSLKFQYVVMPGKAGK